MYTNNKYTNKIKPGAVSVNKEAEEGRDAKISWEGDSLQVLLKSTIYVLHCFEKRSNRIEKKDIQTAEMRLKRVRARLAEESRHAKREERKATRNDRERSR